MSSDKFHCTNGHCLTDCVLSSIDYDKKFPPGFCPHSGVMVYWKKCETTEKKPTVFQQITASPEVLAEKLAYPTYGIISRTWDFEKDDWGTAEPTWSSAVTPDLCYNTKAEAIAATVARLKEVCDGNQ